MMPNNINKLILLIAGTILTQFSVVTLSASEPENGATGKRQTARAALVFLVAGQSNAGGCGVLSPEVHRELGLHKKRPLVPGSTASEVGLSTDPVDYSHSYMWVPNKGFQAANPETNVRPTTLNSKMHGMELPVIRELEKRFPDNDIFVVKHGPGATTLHHDWNPKRKNGEYATWLGAYQKAMAKLNRDYPEVRVVGLYWDQGESDQKQAKQYETNLRALFTTLRKDTGLNDLQIYVREQGIFQHDKPDFKPIVDAQVKIAKEDGNTHLLELDLGSNDKNFKAWAWTDKNGHLSSKAYLELSKKILTSAKTISKVEATDSWGPFVGPWVRYDKNPIIKLEGKETYSIQNGPQSVIRWKDKWHMFLMTSQPMVTKLAVSDDGLTWSRPNHKHLLKPEMPWEGSYNLAKAAVVRDNEVWLYYFGKKNKTEMVALARSKDLVNWKKEPKPIFSHQDSSLEGSRAFPDCVIKEGETWYMYYDVGFDYNHPRNPDGYAIGVATSKDGINWKDSPKSPMLTTSKRTSTSWDDGMVSQCSVHKIDDWFYMLYSGGTNNYGRQYSGKNRKAFGLARAHHPEGPWEKFPHNPVFKPTGNKDDFDGIYLQHPCPVKVGNQWRLYYNGWTLNPKAKNRIGAEYAIGLAFSKGETD